MGRWVECGGWGGSAVVSIGQWWLVYGQCKVSSGQLWSVMVSSGQLWSVMVSSGDQSWSMNS